jgi:hypothetical protein
MIATALAEHLSDHCVRNVRSCEACGFEHEDLIDLSAQATGCWSDLFASSGCRDKGRAWTLGDGREVLALRIGN